MAELAAAVTFHLFVSALGFQMPFSPTERADMPSQGAMLLEMAALTAAVAVHPLHRCCLLGLGLALWLHLRGLGLLAPLGQSRLLGAGYFLGVTHILHVALHAAELACHVDQRTELSVVVRVAAAGAMLRALLEGL